jgi:hypothetical protein
MSPAGSRPPETSARHAGTPLGVIDELVVAVIEAGGSVWHIEADTKFGEYLVAAELRLPSPPTPGDGPAKGVSRP